MTAYYQAYRVTIPANGRYRLATRGTYLRVLTALSPFEVGFNGNSTTDKIEQGLQIKTAGFDEVNLFNPNGADLDVELAVSDEGVDDSRFSLPSTGLSVRDPGAGSESFLDVVNGLSGIVTALRENTLLRAPLTSLEGATYFSATNALTLVVSAAANTNGAIIRVCSFNLHSSASGQLLVDGKVVVQADSFPDSGHIRDLHVPAGVKIELYSGNTFIDVNAWVEIL